MKKLLSIITIFLLLITLIACDNSTPPEEDPALATLETTYNGLEVIFGDPSNITSNFTLIDNFNNGVTAVWTSSNPEVITLTSQGNGTVIATVTRPANDAEDVQVTLSVVLSINATLSDEVFTRTWQIVLTVIKNTQVEIEINTIADILAITDPSYSGTYQATVTATIFARGGDSMVFAYDGTGIIQVYSGAAATVEVGKVYVISGTITWFYGIWEFNAPTAEEVPGGEVTIPTKEVVTSVDDLVNRLIVEEAHLPATGNASNGNMEPIYTSITGQIHRIPGDGSNYDTYLIEPGSTLVTGSAGSPASGLLVYYGSSHFNDLRLYDGITITIDVMIYTYRTNNNAFALVYVGGPDGIVADSSDEINAQLDYNALTLPERIEASITLPTSLPNGSTVTWQSSNEDIITSDGTLIYPAEETEVTLTATITLNAVVLTKEIVVIALPAPVMPESFEFDFSQLALETSYVQTETSFNVLNQIDSRSYSFTRLHANISARTDVFSGVVLAVRSGNGFQSPYLKTDFLIEDLATINFTMFVWSGDWQNLSHANAINVEVSSDGVTWITLEDIKPLIGLEQDAMLEYSHELATPGDYYVRIYVDAAPDIVSTYQLRLAITKMSFTRVLTP